MEDIKCSQISSVTNINEGPIRKIRELKGQRNFEGGGVGEWPEREKNIFIKHWPHFVGVMIRLAKSLVKPSEYKPKSPSSRSLSSVTSSEGLAE